ncbi:MAG: hypothetical protein AAFZ89_06560 [Bacteroidota bacterium]
MKNNLLKLTSIFIVLFSLAFIGCDKDEDKDPQTIQADIANIAPYIRIIPDASLPVIDATALDGVVFAGTLDDPADNVASWSVQVRKLRGTDTVPLAPLTSFTSFPAEWALTGQELADALGIPTSEIQPGDNVQFVATSTGVDGSTLTFAQLQDDLSGQPEQRQAYEFNSFVACPFLQDEVVGPYDVIRNRFSDDFSPAFFSVQPAVMEVISGPGPNQYTIVGGALPLDGGDDLIIEVNPDTGQVSAGNPDALHFNTAGLGPASYGTITGFTFSCVGFIDLAITSPGFITNFLTLQKQ